MLPPRLLSAVLVLLLAAGRCTAAAVLLRGSGTRTEGVMDAIGWNQRTRMETEAGLSGLRGRGQVLDARDPRYKEKFIQYLTGPLYFDPKCRKQFHRLYNNTRDCTVPAYYKRCARLLIQLASSPRCAER